MKIMKMGRSKGTLKNCTSLTPPASTTTAFKLLGIVNGYWTSLTPPSVPYSNFFGGGRGRGRGAPLAHRPPPKTKHWRSSLPEKKQIGPNLIFFAVFARFLKIYVKKNINIEFYANNYAYRHILSSV